MADTISGYRDSRKVKDENYSVTVRATFPDGYSGRSGLETVSKLSSVSALAIADEVKKWLSALSTDELIVEQTTEGETLRYYSGGSLVREFTVTNTGTMQTLAATIGIYLQENGIDGYLLEDGSGRYKKES